MIPIDLRPHTNAWAATYDRDRARGTVNAWGNSFPAEELPFGGSLALGGIEFELPPKADGAFDHCEALGQRIELPHSCRGVGLLAFGELGAQTVEMAIGSPDGGVEHMTVHVNGWLVEGNPPANSDRLLCSHLHYVGGYELSQLRPAMWSVRVGWTRDDGTWISLGENPFFHVVAMTALGFRDD
ncbi:MAG: hypothetical protein KIT31_14335 [Deltaproteobacteria bacterium]|nr:hypothetical protein [Deltaproteobacteria bacterium]